MTNAVRVKRLQVIISAVLWGCFLGLLMIERKGAASVLAANLLGIESLPAKWFGNQAPGQGKTATQ